ncbi:phosphatidate cytidylyltransferase [Chitinophaga deserti]|uniref:phosphatidate cytidylyltransferase n=1 Tax=Chitinophaga deserti TaxID=2164099 RepID=UPI000D6C02AB|nr:phosphatidate cytidylyltransferase [Chitinophaga deserti]
MKTFITRTITALFFVAIMLGGILWSPLSFFLLFFLVNFFALKEYASLVRHIDADYTEISAWHRNGVLIAGCALMMAIAGDRFEYDGLSLGEIGWVLTFIFLLVMPLGEILMGKDFSLKSIGYSLLGLLYVTVPFGMLVDMSFTVDVVPGFGQVYIWMYPLTLICCIWINDTMAYIVGSLIGRTPFAPAISPKKTIEGTVGGMILAVAAAGVFGYFWGHEWMPLQHWIAFAAIAAIFGTAGDLLESRLKRLAGVKDSGSIMPGHGGFLDRFDSLLVAAPIAWIYMRLFF